MTAYQVSKAAARDIRSIAIYTQDRWGRGQRRRYLDGLHDKLMMLAEMPHLAALRPDIEPPVRIHRHERHMIVYAEQEGGILVVRVLHQSQDVGAILGR